jgi:small subunit ribosomal protein S21
MMDFLQPIWYRRATRDRKWHPTNQHSGPAIDTGLQKETRVQVLVRDNNVDQALKALKKKMQREGIFREMKLRGHYEKPSEKKAREKAEAVRRARKLARKRAQREGLIPMKPKTIGGPGGDRAGRGGPGRGGAGAGAGRSSGGFGGGAGFGGGGGFGR